MTIKRCATCGYDLHINAFDLVYQGSKAYRLNTCKLCWGERRKEWRRKHGMPPEEWARYMRRWRLQKALARRGAR